jgi:SPX domain protein involved in polyphosphate accumulation
LEKYVNLNITGFHKILKKHDRRLHNPCKSFYMGRLREQSWVRGDYSDVIVSLSRAFGFLRGDDEPVEKETEKQAFVRSTRKYWVHTEDISRVKYIILQHLPVFLQKTMAGETDSQL